MTLRGKGGISYNVKDNHFAQGGEGSIHDIIGHPDKVAKLYKSGKITADHERKLVKMIQSPPDRDVMDQIAWPLDVLYENGRFVGFVMHKFKLNEDLNVIYEYGSSAKYPELSWGNKIKIAQNLCVVLNAVHEAGHVCGDFNPKNISVDPSTGRITFVDTDSYHITDGSNIYRCNVGMPEYLPREIQVKMQNGLADAPLPTFSQETDNFALAVHIFQLLMNGVHPFACAILPTTESIVYPDTSESILNGECPFFKQVPGRDIPKFAPPASILPPEIQTLFKQAFIDGHTRPSARPSAVTWYYALEKLFASLRKCPQVPHHEYYNGLTSCPWCAADKRFGSAVVGAKKLAQTSYTPAPPPPPPKPSYTSSYTPSYNPSPASVSSTRGSTTPSYVGANNYRSSSNRRRGNFTKKLFGWIIALGILGALFGFLIWPYFIYPNLSTDDFNTPEIIQTYCKLDEENTLLFTVESCSEDGAIEGYWEEFGQNGYYYKILFQGQITHKKNNGDVKIEWISQTVDTAPQDFTWNNETHADIQDDHRVLTSYSEKSSTQFVSGGGLENSISTVSDLKKMANSSEVFVLREDLDLGNSNWTPIEGFTGTLIGNGHTIQNMTIKSSSSNVGFFSVLEGTVMNLKFENANVEVSGKNENVGILCGKSTGPVSTQISVSGSVQAPQCTYVGGIAGYVECNGASLSSMSNTADVSGNEYVGGIFGYQYSGNLVGSDFHNSGKISAKGNYAGGLMGYATAAYFSYNNHTLNIANMSNTGDVAGKCYVGGLFGYVHASAVESSLSAATNQSSVIGEAYVGCIAGAVENIVVNDCKNTGSTLQATKYVTEEAVKYAYVGGIAGKGYMFNNCTNDVVIDYTSDGLYVGGIAGYASCNDGSMTTLKNTADVSGNEYVGGIFGYQYSGNLEETDFHNSGKITARENYAGGLMGYATAARYSYSDHTYNLTDCSNTGDVTGKCYVGGLFGHVHASSTASSLSTSTNQSSVIGEAYVGCIAGVVENIIVNDCKNTGSTLQATKYVTEEAVKYAYVGGIAGKGYMFNNCTNDVAIDYTSDGLYVGGIAGYVSCNDGSMTTLKNTADISGATYVGGIFGYQYSGNLEETDFHNIGKITARENYAGGLMGYATAARYSYSDHTYNLTDCSNTGDVTGKCYVGGLFGYVHASSTASSLSDSSNQSRVEGDAYVGCIAGVVENIVVSDCKNAGSTLQANKYVVVDSVHYAYVGGIAGKGYMFNNCTNEVAINYTGTGRYVGGIAGYTSCNDGTMTELSNTANITGADYVGGIFGYQYSGNLTQSSLHNIGKITARSDYAGGLIGYATAARYSYSDHTYNLTDSTNTGAIKGKSYVGGLFGHAHASSKNSAIIDSTSSGSVSASSNKGTIAGKLENIEIK